MSGNGCHHVRTIEVREGDDKVLRCAASGCGAELSRIKDYYKNN
jgi:hypothetical protein